VDIEKSLQSLLEQHLESFLGVRFLATEYVTGLPQNGAPTLRSMVMITHPRRMRNPLDQLGEAKSPVLGGLHHEYRLEKDVP
jgi:hypothetical protein